MTMVRRWVGVAALWLLVGCGPRAEDPAETPGGGSTCVASVVGWAARCTAQQRLEIAAVQCPEEGVALVDLGGAPELRIELRRAAGGGFRRVGAWGLSPVGDFADWSQVHPSLRERFDKVTACVRAAEPLGGRAALSASPRRPSALVAPTVFTSIPWLLLAALAGVLAALWPVRRSPIWQRRSALGGVLALATLGLRTALHPGQFFHQNGQGPLWVSVVVSPQHHPYGPGYRAVFGWLRWVARDPDRGVFFAQGALACLAVPCAAFIARRLGAPRALAGALALAVAIDPILGRLSRSESYYGVGASLLFLATALLASAVTARRVRSAGFVLPVLAAGMVLAQHALVHPVGWLAAALCPAVLLLGPGHWRRRVRRTAAAALLIAAVVAVAAAPSMFALLRSPFGTHWTAGGNRLQGLARLQHLRAALPSALALAAALAVAARSWWRGVLSSLVLAVALVALIMADAVGFGAATEWVHQAYLRLYAPVAVVLLAASLGRLPRGRGQALALALVVSVGALVGARRAWPAWTKVPTDAREQEAVRRWRGELPAGEVVYLERAGQRVLSLPFYRGAANLGPSPVVLRVGEFAQDLTRQGRRPFYVHTSVCSTSAGREFCERLERRYAMTKLREVVLPAVPSMVGLGYDVPWVRVALYRVDGPR